MVANFCLLTCALVAAQSADRTEWLLLPRLSRGQELVYRGSFAEESLGRGVQFSRSYQLESRVLILETAPRGIDVAFCTVLKQRTPKPERGDGPQPSSVRLELAHVDLQGRVFADPGASLAVPLDGPATIECGPFVEAPSGRVGMLRTWQTLEVGRPPSTWKVVGTESINGTNYLKLEGLQQSADWDQPRADRKAWRRRDSLWVSLSLGVAYKVERTIERREPAHRDPTQRSSVQYELQSSIQYPDQLFRDRQREILQAQKFGESIGPLLSNPTRFGPRPFEAILTKIDHHLDSQPPTPYREAVLQVKRRAESGKRGESPPASPSEDGSPPKVASLDQQAPDFVVTNLLTKELSHLRQWLGRPILMVFYTPTSQSAAEVLRFGQSIQDKNRQQIAVLAFAFSEDIERVQKQRAEYQLSFPILSGKGLRQTYDVDATPKLVVLDAEGTVRGNYVGWGPETPSAVTEEIKRWLGKDDRTK